MTANAHLAQFNISRLRHPIGHPATKPFEDLIDETNARAEASPGFIWRHGIDSRETDSTAYDDPLVLVNASVWESPQHLRDFAYRAFHRDVFRRRDEWMDGSAAVMWWVVPGDTPSLEECKQRLWFFEQFGSTPFAFRNGERVPQLVMRRHRPDDVAPGTGLCTVAWLDGQPVGRGAWRRIDEAAGRPDTGEVKEMWVEPTAPGSLLGAAILAALAGHARATGITELRLKAARHLEAAVDQLQRFGFEACAPWGEYAGAAPSLTMSTALGPIRRCRLSADDA